MPRWYVLSNQSEYFYNTPPRIQETHLREWRRWFGNLLASLLPQKVKISLAHCRNSKYDDGQEIRPGPPDFYDIREPELPKFATCNQLVDLIWYREGKSFQLWQPSVYEGRKCDGKKTQDGVNDSKQKGLDRYLYWTDRRIILCTKITGAWMNVWGITVTGIVLADTEFCGFKCARYDGITPLNLQSKYNGCVTSFDVHHALSCIKGCLFIARHKEVHNELL